MQNRRFSTLLAALVMGAISATALGQSIPTGSITGQVINEGQGLPGVMVVAKSPSLQSTRTSATGGNGDYAFINLPPGDYTVTYTLSGFQEQVKTVKVSASQQSRLDVTLGLTTVTAAATVVAQSESISTSATQATTYGADLLTKLPTGRTITSAVILSPGLNQNGPNGVSIAGAQSTENLYTVNGVVIVDNVRSSPTNLFIEDAIQETTTTTSSVSAEYGRFTGGVINTITKSGGNTFSGSLRSTLTNDSWRAYSKYRTATGVNPQEGTFVQDVVPTWEATFGGPVIKDRIWFFGAGRYFDTSESGSGVTRFTNIAYTRGDKELRYEGKLTLTPFQNHTLTGSYINTKTENHNYYFTPIAVSDMDSIYDRQQPTDLLAINYNGVLSDSLFVDAQYSRKQFTFENSGGRNTDFVKGTVIRDLIRGVSYNAPIFCAVCGPPETRDNNNYLIKGTYFLSSKSLGSHSIVVGYDDFGGQRKSNNYQSASNYVLYTQTASVVQGTNIYPVIDAGTELDWWPVLQTSVGSDVRTRSAYINDTWRLSNRLSFNLGVRYDKNDASNQAGQVTSKDSAFSPRLAAMFDVMGDGKVRVTASYAQYVAALQETQAGSVSSAGTPADFWWYYDGPGINTGAGPYLSPNAAMQQVMNWFTSRGCPIDNPLASTCTVPLDGANISGVNLQIRDELVSPNTKEYVFGVAGNIGSRGSYRADVVRREYTDFYDLKEDVSTGKVTNPINGALLDLGLVVNSDDYRREYTGLHTQFSYRLGDRLNLGGNWTWSHLIGDLVGETSGSGPTRGGLHSKPEYFDRAWAAPVGSLSSDTRHRVRLFGTFDVPLPKSFGSLTLSAVQSWDTGTPYGAVGSVATRAYVTNPGYVSTPASVTYYYTARDAFRTDDIYRTDVSFYYSYRFADTVEVFLSPQIYNLFNHQKVTTVNTAVETRVNTGAAYAAFNPFTTKPVQGPRNTGANWNYGSLFGQPTDPTHYQSPRSFQVSLGVRF